MYGVLCGTGIINIRLKVVPHTMFIVVIFFLCVPLYKFYYRLKSTILCGGSVLVEFGNQGHQGVNIKL